MIDIRLPKIDGKTQEQQMVQMRSYLYQLAEQLNWALSTIETSNSTSLSKSEAASAVAAEGEDNAKKTFNQVKSLIIKSAEIVNAYYEEINKKLVSEYEAYSDFGDFMEYATGEFTATSTEIAQIYTNIQEIISNVSDIENTTISVTAHINSGLLYTDDSGVPIYGLEIGQRTEENGVETFNKYARFTANKLAFFDQNGKEVAYISDRKLYITDVEIIGTFREGGFKDVVNVTNGEVVTKWVGIGG